MADGQDRELLNTASSSDDGVMGWIAPVHHDRWRELFGLDLDNEPGRPIVVERLLEVAYELGLVVPFDWPTWWQQHHDDGTNTRAVHSAADAVRFLTSCIRSDRFSDGELDRAIGNGTIRRALDRLWEWFAAATSLPDGGVAEWASYSDDHRYRRWYERRWAAGPSLCWVGLNPGTGDTDGKARPTLGRVEGWARRASCGAVTVVNLFSYRSTDPKMLRSSQADIIGDLTDETIQRETQRARVTLAAWGADRAARTGRAAEVTAMLRDPICAGTTKSGEPLHPLYQPADKLLIPYLRLET